MTEGRQVRHIGYHPSAVRFQKAILHYGIW